ncbi:hypothetical protein HY449_02290 [Candidatus Pacearchaeota archaeon]|nr:hypothetical protein [Candidatus Pacearchaeota archaeon]
MDIKKQILVSFVVLAGVLFLMGIASAANVHGVSVTIDDVAATANPAVIAGDSVIARVVFTSDVTTSDLKVRLEIEGDKTDVAQTTSPFEVESGKTYVKKLTLKIPNELEDEVSDDALLNLRIWGGESTDFTESFDVRVQRPSYDASFMSISTSQTVEAGKILPVDVVVKNVGYNELNNLYVTASFPDLGVKKTGYFGDLISVEDDDENDFVRARLLLEVPYNVKSGSYSLQVEAKSGSFDAVKSQDVTVKNGLSSNVFVSGNQIVVANPTSQLLALKLVPETTGNALVTLSESIVVIPAGTSRTITATSSGNDNYKVNIFTADGELLDSVTVSPSASTSSGGNAVAVLTVILTIVFLVLLVVLIVLVTKKPEKTELGESYY